MVEAAKAQKSNLDSIKNKLNEAFKITKELINEDPKEKGWKSYHNEATLQAFTKNDKTTKLDMIKSFYSQLYIKQLAIGILNVSPKDAVDLMLYDTQGLLFIRSTVDKCQTYDIIQDGEIVFRYILSKKPNLFVSRRDFVLASTYEKNEDGSYNIVFVSIEDPKVKADAVRALTIFYGAKFTPTDKPDQCKIFAVELNDLKGSLPTFIVNSNQKDAGLAPKSYNEYLSKHKVQKSEVKPLY